MNRKFIISILIIGILWARPFTPAWPPINFSYLFVHNVFSSTNFNESYFVGPSFLKNFRNKMIEVTIGDNEKWKPVYFTNYNKTLQQVTVPELQYTNGHYNRWANAYKYKINDIPFPIGYIHNQRNFMTDHPYHGNNMIRFILILQWLLLQIVFFLWVKKIKW